MAIPCPSCGREYDVTLFQFGRTIHCTCGERVGRTIERRLEDIEPPRFICDVMLGRLARWLRVLDYDTAYESDIEDGDLARRALEERRVIFTRDQKLPEEWRVGGACVVLESEEPMAQLAELMQRVGLKRPQRLFRRCLECNARLEVATMEEASQRVPERVLTTRSDFQRCPMCQRVYWEGDHTRRMRKQLESVFGG
jgi:uncharacterized protein with PIN domain